MALRKFGRNYVLNIQASESGSPVDRSTITVTPPFTLEFDITRNMSGGSNVASFRVLNLNAKRRAQIRENVTDWHDRVIQLTAGYGNNLSLVFDGTITQAWSVREGVNFVTQIESFDGGFAFANATSNLPFPANAEQVDIISTLMGDLKGYGISIGAIGSFPGKLTRGNSYSGQTCDLLRQLTGGRFYIDNGKAYALADSECIPGPVTLISKDSGLLNTPYREQTIVTIDMLFEPKLIVGQQVTLDSITADKDINGEYKVISLKHRGTISDAVCGNAITTVQLFQPLGSQGLSFAGSP